MPPGLADPVLGWEGGGGCFVSLTWLQAFWGQGHTYSISACHQSTLHHPDHKADVQPVSVGLCKDLGAKLWGLDKVYSSTTIPYTLLDDKVGIPNETLLKNFGGHLGGCWGVLPRLCLGNEGPNTPQTAGSAAFRWPLAEGNSFIPGHTLGRAAWSLYHPI